jgi:hypothetical protein
MHVHDDDPGFGAERCCKMLLHESLPRNC